jgi:hypothetical protein
MDEYDILELLKTRLSLDVREGSSLMYGIDDEEIWTDNKTVQLLLDGVVISEVRL